MTGVWRYRETGEGLGEGYERRYSGKGDGPSDGGSIFVRTWCREHLISSCTILSYNELHTLSFPSIALTRSFRDNLDPQGCVVSYLLTLFLPFLSLSRCFSHVSFGMPREVLWRFDYGHSAC